MDREEIFRMARAAGFADSSGVVHAFYQLERFAALVSKHEREECADICEEEAEALMKISQQVDRDKEAYVEQANICACLAEQIRVKGAQ